MISFVVRLNFASEDRAEITEILRQLALASRQEPGCLNYIPHHLQDDLDTVLIYEQYQDQAALHAHNESAHFKQYAVAGLYQKMRDRSREDLIVLA
jgi:quinol monooxygenase YgiN